MNRWVRQWGAELGQGGRTFGWAVWLLAVQALVSAEVEHTDSAKLVLGLSLAALFVLLVAGSFPLRRGLVTTKRAESLGRKVEVGS